MSALHGTAVKSKLKALPHFLPHADAETPMVREPSKDIAPSPLGLKSIVIALEVEALTKE